MKHKRKHVLPLRGHLFSKTAAYHRLQALGKLVGRFCICPVTHSYPIDRLWPVIYCLLCWNSGKIEQSIILWNRLKQEDILYWLQAELHGSYPTIRHFMCHLVLKRIMLLMQLNKSHYKEISNSYNFWLNKYWAHFADCGSLVQKTCHPCGCDYNSLASQTVGIYTELGAPMPQCGRVTLRQTVHSQYKSETTRRRFSAELSSSPPKQGWWGPGSSSLPAPITISFLQSSVVWSQW